MVWALVDINPADKEFPTETFFSPAIFGCFIGGSR